MSVPTYEEFMLPILRLAADGTEHRYGPALDRVSAELRLTDADRAERLPSGGMTRVYNRFGWAVNYLAQAGLLEKPGRGQFRITPRGIDLVREKLSRIDNEVLSRFPEFLAFKGRKRVEDAAPQQLSIREEVDTPEERLEEAYVELRDALARELLDRVLKASPRFFERMVVDLLVAMGYGGSRADAAQVVGRSGDGGIDGTIKEDKLGLDVVYIQAKRWEGTVGRPVVQSFAGSLDGERAIKGVLITTSGFSDEAKEFARRIHKKIVLVEGPQLAQLMIDYGIGVTAAKQITVSRVYSDYFEESE